jgi:hypothetical protein
MRVNSALKVFLNHGYVVRSGIACVMIAFWFTASSFTGPSDRDLRAKQANLIIREIGHRLLLQSGDFASRVLPVKEVEAGTFILSFENEFVFDHDSLMMLASNSFPKAEFPSGYTVTVYECFTKNIVYGFQINSISRDIMACQGRHQPSGCYTIEIALPDLYAVEENKKAEAAPVAENVVRKKAKAEKNILLEDDALDSRPKLANLNTYKGSPKEIKQKPADTKTTTFDFPSMNVMYSGMLVLLGVTLLVGRFGKILKREPVKSENESLTNEPAPPVGLPLGKFTFDVKGQRLLLESEVITLTDKECKVLELLSENFGELIPRDTLMQKIWISEGVITGRSLDMFVSKLRKKLSGDPQLKITNVHAKGYKLEIAAA